MSKTVIFQTIQLSKQNSYISNNSVLHTKTVPFQMIQVSISMLFKCQNSPISSNSVKCKYAV